MRKKSFGFTPLEILNSNGTEKLKGKNRRQSKSLTGFTLIELLIVIAIIGLLSSVVLASLNSARAKSRDAKRRADLRQLSIALEMYFDDNNGYPSSDIGSGVAWRSSGADCESYNGSGTYTTSGPLGWIPDLAPTYIPVLPLDPRPLGGDGCYLYISNGVDYKLLAHRTTESLCPVPVSDPMYDAVRPLQPCTFMLHTPGGNW